ncbi:hypothetical protein IKF15_01745 [Candidatus Saccharibacteria bacterium]|nr:hypothetical protein [Candidatus Saccharibacteria bacterium]
MAWQTVATTGLSDGSSTYGYVYLQYDDSSSGTSRSSRLRFEIRSGYSVYIYIDNLALDGSGVSGRFLCQGTMDFWTGSLANGTRTFTWSCPWYSGTRSYSCSGYIPSGITAPSGLSVSLNSKTYNSASLKVSISSYGVPSGTDGRYIEAAILNQNSYGASYRYAVARNTTSSTIMVNNSSNANPSSFNIEGNHKYWYGGYASNTQASTSTVTGSFYTPCPPLATLAYANQTYSSYNKVNAQINYTRQADGGAETRTGYYRYSTDGGTNYSSWISFGTISVAVGTTANLIANLPTDSNITLQAKINTPNGGDSTIKTITFSTLATHAAPNFSNFEYRDTNATTTEMTGNDQTMIQGQSTPLVTISTANKATGNDGVSVSNYAITFVGQSKTLEYSSSEAVSTSLNAPAESGTSNLTVSAVDSLSTAKAVSKPVTIYSWAKPTISALIQRVNNFESEAKLNASGTYSPILINGVVKNTIALEYRTKKSSSSEWSGWTQRTVTISGANWSLSNLSITLDNNYQWDIQVRAVDAFSNTATDLSLSVGMPNFFIGVDGRVSIGMRPSKTLASTDRGHLEVDGPVYSKGVPLVSSHVGQIIMTTTLNTAAKVQAIYGGTWVAWGAGRVPVGIGSNGTTNYSTVEATGGEEKHTLTIAEMPSHTHTQNSHSHTTYNRWNSFAAGNLSGYGYTCPANGWAQDGWQQDYTGGTTATNQNTGGGGSHENRQPYITVYMWKRTA